MPDPSDLKRIPILKHLDDRDLRKLLSVAKEREFPGGAVIFKEGTEQDSLFVILSGNVRISKETFSGEQKSIATLAPGAFFGEMALFDDYVRSATANAATDARLIEISKDAFLDFLAGSAAGASKLMLEIMKTVAPRIRQTNKELVALYEAGRVIGEPVELGEMLSSILAILSDSTSCERGSVFLVNPAATVLECCAAFGYEADPSGWTEPVEGGIADLILRSEGPSIIENFERDTRSESIEPVGYETPSMLGVALRLQGQPLGTIVLCDKTDSAGIPVPFTSGDANLLEGVAAEVAGAIESARLHEEAREREKLDRVYFRH